MLAAQVQVPVAVCSRARVMRVSVHIQTPRERQPSNSETERNQQATADELTALLELRRNRPAKGDDCGSPEGQQQRVTDGTPDGQAERARVSSRPERRNPNASIDPVSTVGIIGLDS